MIRVSDTVSSNLPGTSAKARANSHTSGSANTALRTATPAVTTSRALKAKAPRRQASSRDFNVR